jgi:hypothetical protein
VIVPTSTGLNEEVIKQIKLWLRNNIPKWEHFKIQAHGKYLGIVMGPQAKDAQWRKPISEYCSRAKAIGSVHAPISVSTYLYNTSAVSVLQYVAQVCSIPETLRRAERVAIHKIWHFATNALTMQSFLNLHTWGAPKIRSVMSEMYATQLRTAWRFKDVWQQWLEQIITTTDFHGNLVVVARDSLTPDFWDHPPIAIFLSDAWYGTPHEPIKTQVATLIKANIKANEHREGAQNYGMPAHQPTHQRPQIQKWASSAFLQHMYPDDLTKLLQRRLHKILGVSFEPDSLNLALPLVRTLKPHIVVQVIKTWANSWATSHRFHEACRLSCLFGCPDGVDSINHYAFCPFLRDVMIRCSSDPSDPTYYSLLGLVNPSRDTLKGIAAMFYAYHAVSFHPAARALLSSRTQQVPNTDSQLFQQIFAGSFEAALRHAC